MHEVSLLRLYTLRLCYLILAVGLGLVIWPTVIHHSPEQAVAHGIQLSLFAGLGLTAVLGLRYPVDDPAVVVRAYLESDLPSCIRAAAVARSPGDACRGQ